MNWITANYHTHSALCGHAWGTHREYIQVAVDAGLETLGFSDHSPWVYEPGYRSGSRMTVEQASHYVKELRELAEEFKDRIRILVGFEAEYFPRHYPEHIEMCKTLGIDYLIMGQHSIGEEEEGIVAGAPTKDPGRLRCYVDQVIEGIHTGRYAYLAHPDMMNFIGDPDLYREEMLRLCLAAKAQGMPVEINLLGIRDHRHYPNRPFLEVCALAGSTMVLGCDAHDPASVNDVASETMALALAKEYGLTVLRKLDTL